MEEEPGEQPSRDIPPGQQGEGESAGGPPPGELTEYHNYYTHFSYGEFLYYKKTAKVLMYSTSPS